MATLISLSDDDDLVLGQDDKYRHKDTDSEDRPTSSEYLMSSEAEYEDSSKDKDIDTTSTDINTLNTLNTKFHIS